jgi:hypothetical protein
MHGPYQSPSAEGPAIVRHDLEPRRGSCSWRTETIELWGDARARLLQGTGMNLAEAVLLGIRQKHRE